MSCWLITEFRAFAISICFNIKIKDQFIEIEYGIPNRFVVFITNDGQLCVFKINWYTRRFIDFT